MTINIAHSHVAEGFEPVAHAFAANFHTQGEVGAAFAATYGGELVVDVWGGLADIRTRRPWTADTLQLIFSGTKALVATCLLILVDRGQLDPDACVATYWPDFAAHGKESIRVYEIASHQARLPGIAVALRQADVLDDHRMARLLASQMQEADPRGASAYHPLTYGWLCGELVRRIDGRSIGQFFDEEIAQPLGLELWIGLPQSEEHRVSCLNYGLPWTSFATHHFAADDLLKRVWGNPPLFPPDALPWNKREWHAAEIPGAGAIGTARSIARFYACLANAGVLEGVKLFAPETLERGRRCLSRRHDDLADEPQAFAFGFELQTENLMLGPVSDAFGHGGAGGSAHGAWPKERVGFSYCMNELRDYGGADHRASALLTALHGAVLGHTAAG